MNTNLLEWNAPQQGSGIVPLLPIAVEELRRNLIPLVSVFVVIAFAALAWGMLRSSTYRATTTILVEDKNIITPLLEGRTVTTDDSNRAVIASEVVYGHRIMRQILQAGGWMDAQPTPTPLEQEQLISEISGRTTIQVTDHTRTGADDPGLSLIKIAYTDSDPKRAHLVTKRYAELLIAESLAAKERESKVAYRFIGSEASKYRRALSDAESKLAAYRMANPDARAGADLEVSARIAELRRTVDSARVDLSGLNSQGGQLQTQLSQESEVGSGLSRSGQFRAQMAELQSERNRLALRYTSQHPDVVQVDSQISDLQQQFKNGGSPAQPNSAGAANIGVSAGLNPLYGQLRSNLSEVRRQRAAAAARTATGQALLDRELARSRQMIMSEGTLDALIRDHELNREIYQDLLRRRENARVSMNLDAESGNLKFHIQEPAATPLAPSGLRLMHFAGAGLLLAVVVPLLLLSLRLKNDSRVRSSTQIERDLGLPVLGSIPLHLTRDKQAVAQRKFSLASALFLSVPLVYGLILILKAVGAL